MTTIGGALREGADRLRSFSPTARLDAELILARVLQTTRARLVADLPVELPPAGFQHFDTLICRRAAGEPVAYLTGEREFYGLALHVDRRVLVPRPETELLVDLALGHAARYSPETPLQIADIGTGSGAIAVAVAAALPRARVAAVDLSPLALEVACLNVRRHRLEDRITLIEGDGLRALPGPADLLLSNPPYTVLAEVDENVRRHEPHLALDGGADGLDIIRELIRDAPRYLRDTMLIEIAAWQGQAALALAREAFAGARIAIHRDLAGHDRVLEIQVEDS